ncbi:lysozyme inhibitor LprI family protein [uncultured Desulfovibrio sp.]|uniref:lysozyme inhibitor LprI family protein n=1 Tax=uncultured Desulfovibrio sp. TaxID=167968 RepID=UPI0026135042|nr:lysozyme inhibitor LprI family protein [uncultured Desulfovibrio sp.]
MKHIITVLIVCFFTVTFQTKSYSLAENEYNELLKIPYFKQADKELSAVWKEVYNSLHGDYKKQILDSQRQWLKSGRDKSAKALIEEEGFSIEDAYTIAVYLRIGDLYVIQHNNSLSPDQYGSAKADGYYDDMMYEKAVDIIKKHKNSDNQILAIKSTQGKYLGFMEEEGMMVGFSIQKPSYAQVFISCSKEKTLEFFGSLSAGGMVEATYQITYVEEGPDGPEVYLSCKAGRRLAD